MADAELAFKLLGQFEVRRGDVAVNLGSARAEAVLAFLLLHRDRPQPRQRVAFVLWPDSAEAQALTNLRHVLHNLRRALPGLDRHLEVTARTLGWRPGARYRLDVADLEAAVDRRDWQEAVNAYGGALLAGWTDEWVEEPRARLRQRFLDALSRLVAERKARGDLAGAVRHAERLLREEPLREETHLTLMRLHDARGDRARAVRVYHECAAVLERELGVEPAPETRAAYDELLAVDEKADARLGGVPLVGRRAERAALTAVWQAARDGRAQVVLLAGEAGVGKTRLADEFLAWCAHRGAVTAVARAYPGEGTLAYGPVVAWLRALPPPRRWRALAGPYLAELARLLPELAATAPELATVRPPGGDQRHQLYDAVRQVLRGRPEPLVLMADDVQWWDVETLRMLHYLVRADGPAPLVAVATARREDIDSAGPLRDLLIALRAAGTLTEIELHRLAPAETALLAEHLGRVPLTSAQARALHMRTEGNPLFVVEAMRAGRLDGNDLTPRVQAVIAARLARLSDEARELAEVAATIGRHFTAELVALAGQVDENAVVRGLDELWRRRIIREHDANAYDFSHDKIREVAYLALSPVRRRYLHRQVARALLAAHAGDPDPVSAQLARHHQAAGAVGEAVRWYARAADVAQRVYADGESARLLGKALDLVRAEPDTPDRQARELALLTALAAPLVASEGYSSPRVRRMHRRALELAGSLGVDLEPPLVRSLALDALVHAEFAAARDFGARLRDRAARTGDHVLVVEGEYVLGVTAFWAADFARARTHFENVAAHYRPELRDEHLLRYAQDPKVICLTRLACTLWFLGEPEAAVAARDEGLALAEEIGHPYSLSTGLLFASLLALDMSDHDALRGYVARFDGLRTPDAGPQTWSGFEAFRAYLDVVDGRVAGLAAIQGLLADPRLAESAAPGQRATLVRVLLAACDAAGAADAGLAAADELLATPCSDIWHAEAHRLRRKFPGTQQPANA